jgi:Protein of unknown function (DUF2510)/zinc-ribbon family
MAAAEHITTAGEAGAQMIIIFGLRRLKKGLGPVMLRCSNCGMSPLVLFRVSTWFALFFIPFIPVSFRHFTACGNCKRVEPVSSSQVESARAQQDAVTAAGHDGTAATPPQPATLESAVNQWAAVGRAPSGSPASKADPAGSLPTYPQNSPPPQAPPGWFPDPSGTDTNRYWDGQQWTGHTAPMA